jgi:hypothetical protein
VTACAGSTGPLALGEAAAPRGVDRAQRSVVTRQPQTTPLLVRYGVGGRGSVRAASDGCRVESRD